MAQDGGIGVINESLPELHAQLVQDPLVVDNLRISIFAFSDSADVILPLTKAADIADMPGLAASGPPVMARYFACSGRQSRVISKR